jgi:hypothetical protein
MHPKIQKVEAYQTSDAELWNKLEYAEQHQAMLDKSDMMEEVFKEHKDNMEEYFGRKVYYNPNGWECNKSPIGVCVYEEDCIETYGDECCGFCGLPEERK